MIFVLDNFDSFTYNLVHLLYEFESDIKVCRNRSITVEEVITLAPEAIILSPGPGRPKTAGIMPQLIEKAVSKQIPMLGVCLGHQGIGEFFGASVVPAKSIMHGKLSEIRHDGKGLFSNLPDSFNAVRYHSLALDEATIPEELEITCRTADGEVMGIRHKKFLIEGIQYHPESILSSCGKNQIHNFIKMVRERI